MLGHIDLTPHLVQSVRDAVDVLAIAEDHTRLQRRGRRWVGLCPLHREKTPSFSVDADQGLFYCFGCGTGGDAIKLYMLVSGDDFPAAVEALARRFGVPLPPPGRRRGTRPGPDVEGALEAACRWFQEQLARHAEPRQYLTRRQIPAELVERYGLGYAPPGWSHLLDALRSEVPTEALLAAGLIAEAEQRPGHYYDRFRQRLIFPVRNAAGRLVGFGGRALGDDPAKYVNTPETDRFRKGTLLYGLDQAKRFLRESHRAVLVEGYFDLLGAAASGVEGVVASMGTALTAEQARLLARHTEEVVVAYDGDPAGVAAARRSLGVLLTAGLAVRRARLPPGADPDSLRLEEGEEKLRAFLEEAPDAVEAELDELLAPGQARDPRAQARLVAPVVELLRPIPDAILRYGYGRRAAERLGVPFELLAPKLGVSRERRGPALRAEAQATPVDRTPGRDLEEAVLRLLLTSLSPDGEAPGIEPPDASELPAEEVFWDPACQSLYAALSEAFRQLGESGRLPTLGLLRESLEPTGKAVDLMAKLLLERGDAPKENPRGPTALGATLRQSLDQLRRRWCDRRLRELSRDIHEAQRAGDGARLQSLVEEKSALSRELHHKVIHGHPRPMGSRTGLGTSRSSS